MRKQLIIQFLSEALLMTMISFTLALVLVYFALPYLNKIAGKEMQMLWDVPLFWMLSALFIIITGVVAGSYPALYLSSFKPVRVLKGVFKTGKYAALPRKVLVVLQFSISIILIIGTIVVFRQIQSGKNRDAGYDSRGLVIIRPYNGDFHDHLSAVRNDLTQTGLISDVAEGSFISKGSRTVGGMQWRGKDPALQDNLMTFGVSPEYGKTVKWDIIAGRDFSKNLSTDSSAVILNEAAVAYMNFKNPVGEIINWEKPYRVIGVTKNIIMQSPFEPAMPTIFYIDGANFLNIKVKPSAQLSKALAAIESVYKKYSPGTPFDYKLADEEYSKKFEDEERVQSIAIAFTIFAIVISCLGLFGLASFVAEQRTKEIGIRKIVGASVFNIWLILSFEFLTLVTIAVLIAAPCAWYAMHAWLQNYAYRSPLSWWIFAAAACGALLITLMTVSFQSIKAAIMNPVSALRAE